MQVSMKRTKVEKGILIDMLATSVAVLSGNLLIGKGVIRAD